MKVFFTKSDGVSYGGGLAEPFLHLDRIIADKFQDENINFPFEEIEIQLASLAPKANKSYISWYNKLPVYYRGKNMARVILPVAETEKTLDAVFQLIYKAFDILAAKKKKTDVVDTEKIKAALSQLEKELRQADLAELNRKYELLLRQEVIEKVRHERLVREQSNGEKKRLIQDLRFYYRLPSIEYLYFAPYDNRFCDKILEKLRERKFRLPNYTHLYILVSDTFENALYHAIRIENWFVYGVAVLENYADYAAKQEAEKKRIVFELIKRGLHDIAKLDNLDAKTLGEVLDEVESSV